MRHLINIVDSVDNNPFEKELNLIASNLDQIADDADDVSEDADPAQMPTTPAPNVVPEIDYATKQDNKKVVPVLFNALKATKQIPANSTVEDTLVEKEEKGRISCIRTKNLNSQQVLTAAASLGLRETPLTDLQAACSGQFTIHSFITPNNVTLTVVLAGRKKAAAAAGAAGDLVLTGKDLTPVKLGLAGTYNSREELAKKTKLAVQKNIKNEKISKALVELVDIAMNRGKGQLSPESLEYIMPIRGMISQDFGEILAPLSLAQDQDNINFPSGNEKLIDVTVANKIRYSVKALGGSGTSMNSLGSLLDEYEATLTDEGKKLLFQNGIKVWRSVNKKEGKVVDKICYAAYLNQTPEYLSYVTILGTDFKTFDELKQLLKPLLANLDYPGFLKMILPATQAGHWNINIGMPTDSNYYLGLTDKRPAPGVAGKFSYDNDPVDGAANIITYSLGKGFEFMVRRGPNKQQYKDIMNDMIRQLNCWLGHVTITSDGALEITSEPFGNLDFEFDYHAPSHIAGNNRPGFLIVPPSKGDKSKKNSKSEIEPSPSVTDAEPKPKAKLNLRPVGAKPKNTKVKEPERRERRDQKSTGLGRERRT